MIELEDLPRMQSLSPARDLDELYQTQLQLPSPKVNTAVGVVLVKPKIVVPKLGKLIKPIVKVPLTEISLEAPTPTPVPLNTVEPTVESTPPSTGTYNCKTNIIGGAFHYTTLVRIYENK